MYRSKIISVDSCRPELIVVSYVGNEIKIVKNREFFLNDKIVSNVQNYSREGQTGTHNRSNCTTWTTWLVKAHTISDG